MQVSKSRMYVRSVCINSAMMNSFFRVDFLRASVIESVGGRGRVEEDGSCFLIEVEGPVDRIELVGETMDPELIMSNFPLSLDSRDESLDRSPGNDVVVDPLPLSVPSLPEEMDVTVPDPPPANDEVDA